MGMQRRVQIRSMLEQTGMDDQRAALDRLHIRVGQDIAVEIDLQQGGRRDLGKHPIRALDQHVIRLARHPEPEMIVGQIVDPVMRQDAVPGREIDAGLPLCSTDLIPNRLALGDELHCHNAIVSWRLQSPDAKPAFRNAQRPGPPVQVQSPASGMTSATNRCRRSTLSAIDWPRKSKINSWTPSAAKVLMSPA